jgi:hypothetical protein
LDPSQLISKQGGRDTADAGWMGGRATGMGVHGALVVLKYENGDEHKVNNVMPTVAVKTDKWWV